MVMAAGAVMHATGTTKLNELGGLASPLRWVLVPYLVAAVSITAFPMLVGLGADELYTEHASGVDRRWVTMLLYVASVGTLLAVAVKLPYFAFFGPGRAAVTTSVPWGMYAAMGAGAVLSIVVGIFPGELLEAFRLHAEPPPFTTESVVFGLEVLALAAIGAWLVLPKLAGRDTVTLDSDWLYRKAGRPVRVLVQQPLEAAFTAAEHAVAWTVHTATRLVATPEQGLAWILGRTADVRDHRTSATMTKLGRPPLGAAVAAIFITVGLVVVVAEVF
jgi:multicomponent Na+:H+ antiporter subunit D